MVGNRVVENHEPSENKSYKITERTVSPGGTVSRLLHVVCLARGLHGSLRTKRKDKMSSTTATRSEIADAEALPLLDLVKYQEGSIVSRVLVSRESGTITLFAFEEGQALSEHTAPFDALVQMLEGEMEISIDRKPLSAKAGDLVLMPAHRPHALKAITRAKMLLTMIRSPATG